jgi:hypothetical protein
VGKFLVLYNSPIPAAEMMASATPEQTQAAGYSILQAESLDGAAKMVEDHPHLETPGGTIDVLEFLAMPGM